MHHTLCMLAISVWVALVNYELEALICYANTICAVHLVLFHSRICPGAGADADTENHKLYRTVVAVDVE